MLVSAVVDILLILLSLAEGTEDTAFAFLIMGLIAFVPLMLLRFEAKKPISEPVYFEKRLSWWDLLIGFLTGELVLAANIIAVSYDLLSGKFDLVTVECSAIGRVQFHSLRAAVFHESPRRSLT